MNIDFLLNILTLRRPHDSTTERLFVEILYESLPGASMDDFGNVVVEVGESNTLFSCHTDTVSRTDGRQVVLFDGRFAWLDNGKPGQSLGADDGAGVWLMCHMILNQKPGLYIFHRGEEVGGLGSRHIAKNPALLSNIDRAIAFDRRGVKDVITHQMGRRCCSDEFAFALANELGMPYRPSDQGIFTDTANYMDIVPECTNISVGYEGEHGPREKLDVLHLMDLFDTIMDIDFERLPTDRDPKVNDDPQLSLLDLCVERAEDVAIYFESKGYSVDDVERCLDEAVWEYEGWTI